MADENNITTLAKRLRPFIKLAAQEMVPVTPYDHGNLQGLADDDHSQYIHNTSARTIVAQHTFAPNSAAAPFLLGANAQGQLVVGLMADQLNRTVAAGDGLVGGGGLDQDISLAVGAGDGLSVGADSVSLTTPGTLNYQTTNSSAGNHTHAITSSSNPGSAASLLASDASGYLHLVALYTDALRDRSGGNLSLEPAGDLILNPVGLDILPGSASAYNLGAINKKYLSLHAAELWVETLVTQGTMATIGGRILVAPATILTRDLAAASTSFYVKHDQLASGDSVYLEANGQIEFIGITSSGTLQPEGDYSYSIIRDLDGSGANDWNAGDAVLNTGATGDGYIDIYSQHSIRGDAQYGPTIVGNVRTASSYDAVVEAWAIGNLNGLYGYGVDTYGAAFGKYEDGRSFITIDSDNIKIINRIGGINYERITLSSTGVLAIKDSSGNPVLTFDASDGAEITKKLTMPGVESAIAIGSTPPSANNAGTGIWIDRSGFYSLSSDVQQFFIDTGTGQMKIGAYDTAMFMYPVTIDGNGILIKDDATGSEVASHIRFASHSGLKAEIYGKYSGAGVFNELFIVANPSTNPAGILYLNGQTVYLNSSGAGAVSSEDLRINEGLTVGDSMVVSPQGVITLLEVEDPPIPSAGFGTLWAYDGSWLKYRANEGIVLNMSPWIDWSGSAVVTGFSGTPSVSVKYCVLGRVVIVVWGINGTSNSSAFNITLPYTPGSPAAYLPVRCQDNGSWLIGLARAGAGNLTFYKTMDGGGWTANGTKSSYGEIMYVI